MKGFVTLAMWLDKRGLAFVLAPARSLVAWAGKRAESVLLNRIAAVVPRIAAVVPRIERLLLHFDGRQYIPR